MISKIFLILNTCTIYRPKVAQEEKSEIYPVYKKEIYYFLIICKTLKKIVTRKGC